MYCSFCNSADHNIKKCNCNELRVLFSRIKYEFRRRTASQAFTWMIHNLLLRQLRGFASKVKLPTNMNYHPLAATIIIHEYYTTIPMADECMTEFLFYRYMVFIKEGILPKDAKQMYDRLLEQGHAVIVFQGRRNSLVNLRTRAHNDPNVFDSIIHSIEDGSFEQLFGIVSSIEEIFQFIPEIKEHYKNVVMYMNMGEDYLRHIFGDHVRTVQDVFHDMPYLRNIYYLLISEIRSNIPHIEYSVIKSGEMMPTEECGICLDVTSNVYLNCRHSFCGDCISKHLKTKYIVSENNFAPCPYCRADICRITSINETVNFRIQSYF